MASIADQIVDAVETALGNVSTGNGYNFDYQAVRREQSEPRDESELASGPIMFLYVAGGTYGDATVNAWTESMVVHVEVVQIHDSSTFTDPSDTMRRHMVDDVVKALSQDLELGGRVQQVALNWQRLEPQNPREVAAAIEATLTYQHVLDDPGAQ